MAGEDPLHSQSTSLPDRFAPGLAMRFLQEIEDSYADPDSRLRSDQTRPRESEKLKKML